MSLAALAVALLALAALVGVVRGWRGDGRRRGLRLALQLLAALLLYACLLPPSTRESFRAGELLVLTPGASAEQLAAAAREPSVALPGVAAPPAIERVADLAAALRRHPQRQRLRVLGGGLPARDRDAARGRVTRFDAAPLPPGLVELALPGSVPAGRLWRLAGRVEGYPGGRVELRDPAGAMAARQSLDGGGRFALAAAAKLPGGSRFRLDLYDAEGRRAASTEVPLAVRSGTRLRGLLLAGAPDPELKYLRRWALDAGLDLELEVALSEGVALRRDAPALTPEALARLDLLLIDARAWAALSAAERQALGEAVRGGLGLLLRPGAAPAAAVVADWAALGYRLAAAPPDAAVALEPAFDAEGLGAVFHRAPLRVEAEGAAPLLRAADGSALAWLRGLGRGRVALWLLTDSHRLQLAGGAAAFGSLWADRLGAIARPQAGPPALPALVWLDQRAAFCGLSGTAQVRDPDARLVPLRIDARGCAAYWPAAGGWHRLLQNGAEWPFYVRRPEDAPSLAAGETRRATAALLSPSSAGPDTELRARPRSRWPFFFALLATLGGLWWLERRSAA